MTFEAAWRRLCRIRSIDLVIPETLLRPIGGVNLLVRICKISIYQQIVLGWRDCLNFSRKITVC